MNLWFGLTVFIFIHGQLWGCLLVYLNNYTEIMHMNKRVSFVCVLFNFQVYHWRVGTTLQAKYPNLDLLLHNVSSFQWLPDMGSRVWAKLLSAGACPLRPTSPAWKQRTRETIPTSTLSPKTAVDGHLELKPGRRGAFNLLALNILDPHFFFFFHTEQNSLKVWP